MPLLTTYWLNTQRAAVPRAESGTTETLTDERFFYFRPANCLQFSPRQRYDFPERVGVVALADPVIVVDEGSFFHRKSSCNPVDF